MIWYDSHNVLTLLRIRGSVLPKSLLWAIPAAALCYAIRHAEEKGYLALSHLDPIPNGGNIYSGFTFVLGFSLVFRTSQSYLRYWTAATSIHEMSCEWSDACAGVIAFASISPASSREISEFRHTITRLFSLLHAMALTEVADIREELPLLDINGLSKAELVVLTHGNSQGKKVQIVLSWIKAFIVQMGDCGLLNVPAPILTRVFQELQNGLVNYHKALQIVIWPFPFPITQMNFLLVQIYVLVTPVVLSQVDANVWVCVLYTFVAITCVVGLEYIACELENPFGEDANDLPVLEMQRDMNKFLTMQLNPHIHQPPRLLTKALRDHRKLILSCASPSQSFRCTNSQGSLASGTLGAQIINASKFSRQGRQTFTDIWRGTAVCRTSNLDRLQEWLKCASMDESDHETGGHQTSPSASPWEEEDGQSEATACRPESRRGTGSEGLSRHVRRGSQRKSTFHGEDWDFNRVSRYEWDCERQVEYGSEESISYHVPERKSSHRSMRGKETLQDWNEVVSALNDRLESVMDDHLEAKRKELRLLEGKLGQVTGASSPRSQQSEEKAVVVLAEPSTISLPEVEDDDEHNCEGEEGSECEDEDSDNYSNDDRLGGSEPYLPPTVPTLLMQKSSSRNWSPMTSSPAACAALNASRTCKLSSPGQPVGTLTSCHHCHPLEQKLPRKPCLPPLREACAVYQSPRLCAEL